MALDPNLIIIKNRQRAANIDDNFVASIKRRLLHPIILRRQEGEENPILVAGGRRLEALKKLQIPLEEGIHFKFIDNLSPAEAQVIELEENIKRSDLTWREHVVAIGTIHKTYSELYPNWSLDKTANEINLAKRTIQYILLVYKNINSSLLRDASTIEQAYNILQLAAERRTSAIIDEITVTGANIFSKIENTESSLVSTTFEIPEHKEEKEIIKSEPTIKPLIENSSILVADFTKWIKDYCGPKFNLIHCDFPYGISYEKFGTSGAPHQELEGTYENDIKTYLNLLNCFVSNLDKFCSYSSHIIFWFSMSEYERTKSILKSSGLEVQDHPLIWLKTDRKGILPGAQTYRFPRRIYETALLCSRNKRPLVKQMDNAYGCPHAGNSIHPSQKPEPMLRHFFSMLIDETTDFFDPTAGSGSALRAAEDLGARSVLGLELDEKYAELANSATNTARRLRKVSR